MMSSIFGSARQTLQSIEFDYTLPRTRESSVRPPDPITAPPAAATSFIGSCGPPFGLMDGHAPLSQLNAMPLFDYSSADGVGAGADRTLAVDATKTIYSPTTTLGDLVTASDGAGGMTSCASVSAGPSTSNDIDINHIESFATWEDIGSFLSLYMKHQHMLVPLVHRPSFAQDVLHRRDEVDEAFRGLLLSMVAYTICQCPINWLVGRMDKLQLETLLERCQRGSRIIQIRHQTRPSLVVLASTILDWISSQAASAAELPMNLLSDVRRLVYTLGLNRETPKEGLSSLELQLCRRLYWEAYAIDKTNSLNGHPMILNDMDGVPPLPLEIDDEYMAGDATFPQPEGKLSYMSGFCYVSKLFQVLNGCIVRHRTLQAADPSTGPTTETLQAWVDSKLEEVQDLLTEIPEELQSGSISQDNPSVFGTQAANLYITALCIELALLDLKGKLHPDEDTHNEKARQEIAQRAFRQLEHMPLECLASNGESMRGKVLRVILALLNVSSQEAGTLGEGLWDWWNMFSRVQFLQLMPTAGAS